MTYSRTFKPQIFGTDYGNSGYDGASDTQNRDRRNQLATESQIKAVAAATEQAANNAVERDKIVGNNLVNLKRQSDSAASQGTQYNDAAKLNQDRQDTQVKNKYTSDEAGKDRGKSSDEFTQNRYQQRANQAQDRANLEFSTNAANENLRQQRAAESSIKDRDIVANQNLAQLNSTTTLAGQQAQLQGSLVQSNSQLQGSLAQSKAQVDSTKLSADSQIAAAPAAAKAQVTAALYGSRPGYQGY